MAYAVKINTKRHAWKLGAGSAMKIIFKEIIKF